MSLRNTASKEDGSSPAHVALPKVRTKKLGQILLEEGHIAPRSLNEALRNQKLLKKPLGEILVAHEHLESQRLMHALSRQSAIEHLKDSELPVWHDTTNPEYWIKAGLIPWDRSSGIWRVACHDRAVYIKNKRLIDAEIGPNKMVWAEIRDIRHRQNEIFKEHLVSYSHECLDKEKSCRSLPVLCRRSSWKREIMLLVGCILIGFVWKTIFVMMLSFALLCLFILTLLKCCAFILMVQNNKREDAEPLSSLPLNIPKITLLVPLYKEKNIAKTLVKNLKKLSYPPTHLEAMLVLEADDHQTNQTLSHTNLPPWMHILKASKGEIRTKPRALNYALPFCTGDIIGIYDAEDAPEPDQLIKVAAQFDKADQNTVCLQGRLAYFNRSASLIARCFWLEYSIWFRIILPGIAKMGLLIPLGGTTLFFKAKQLRDIGGWDAFNVTEDADLGVRLARAGYRCDILDSTTFEEASTRPLQWVKQRSRWIKGYMITYLTHIKTHRELLRTLGLKKCIGFHALFVPSCVLALTAPLFWLFWLVPFGYISPSELGVPPTLLWSMSAIFTLSLSVDILVAVFAVPTRSKLATLLWSPVQYLYNFMATFASYKALFELFWAPFYWDKTTHGSKIAYKRASS